MFMVTAPGAEHFRYVEPLLSTNHGDPDSVNSEKYVISRF
jgi:hypothetical protein